MTTNSYTAVRFDGVEYGWSHYCADAKNMARILINTHKSIDDVWPLLDTLDDAHWDQLGTEIVLANR